MGPGSTALGSAPLGSDVLFVDANLATGAGDGTSWANAFRGRLGLREALEASSTGDAIWVAAGEYAPAPPDGDIDASLLVPPGVAVYGGFAGGERTLEERDIEANPAVLTGDLNEDDLPGMNGVSQNIADNARHVVRFDGGGAGTLIDGVTIRAGNARDGGSLASDSVGGNVLVAGGSPTIARCTIEGGYAGEAGGGIAVISGAPTIIDCTIRGNRADSIGGGLACLGPESHAVVEGGLFEGNIGGLGCGAALGPESLVFMEDPAGSLTLDGVVFRENIGLVGSSSGGGVIALGGMLRARECVFEGNEVPAGGGGAFISGCDARFDNCRFLANAAPSDGGGAVHVFGGDFGAFEPVGPPTVLVNCALIGNNGGAVVIGGGEGIFINCTIANNSQGEPFLSWPAFFTAQGARSTIANCIVWNNGLASFMLDNPVFDGQLGFEYILSNTLVQPEVGKPAPMGTMIADPLFLDPLGSDGVAGTSDDGVVLSAGSPAIDAGDSSALPEDALDLDGDGDAGEPVPLDLFGNARRLDDPATPDRGAGPAPIVDIGAAEFVPAVCAADLTGDGVVNSDDLGVLLSAFGAGDGGDVNADGTTDADDLGILLSVFGGSC